LTLILNGASDAVLTPSLTVMVIGDDVPSFEAFGVPESLPSAALKLAQDGLWDTENFSV